MIHLAVLLLAYAGFVALCASMAKHQVETLGRTLMLREQRLLRAAGWAGLAAAYGCAVVAVGWRFGSVLWVAAIMVAGLALTLNMPYRPRGAARAGGVAALTAVGLLLLVKVLVLA
ncbi:MAG: DUF3325 domain-containing protein [Pseudomonadota bacterium]|uniref:DUF3325 domain-containing protein n=1 Tax=Caulobacter sp. CCH9-E1 TaxID=1768768 RepID=UPI000836C079|nr:DUF3325 domain-containing protein [Caulobacter sp. CCH9-E1]